jgi:vacuolar iron transporter family protein
VTAEKAGKPRPHTAASPPHAKGTSRPRPRHHHVEAHFSGSETVRDVVLGMSDGLTVPFALAAGLSGAVANARVILIAGVAELAAGAIAMGLGGYLAARSEADTWASELRREHEEVDEVPSEEQEEVRKIFRGWGLEGDTLERATHAVCADHKRWVDFMMREELGLVEPAVGAALKTSLTIGLSYIAGALIPLFPFLLSMTIHTALLTSTVTTLTALFLVGIFKSRYTGGFWWRNGLETMFIGAAAAGAAYVLVRLLAHET